MPVVSMSMLSISGLKELESLRAGDVTHVLSILDPGHPEPEALVVCNPKHRRTLRFHDEIEPGPGFDLPQSEHIEAILAFGNSLTEESRKGEPTRVLVHCHMGISRSTAAMATILAQLCPEDSEDLAFARLLEIRPQAWPNCLIIAMADDLLGRRGRLVAALGRHYARQLAVRPEIGHYMRENGRGREVDMATG